MCLSRSDTIVGIVYTKDMILVDPNDEIPVASILPFCSRAINAAPKGTTLEKLLADMQASRSHLYFVTDTVGVCRKKVRRRPHRRPHPCTRLPTLTSCAGDVAAATCRACGGYRHDGGPN